MSDKDCTIPPAKSSAARPAEQKIGTGIYFTPAPSFSQSSQNSNQPDGKQGPRNVNSMTRDELESKYRAIWKSVQKLEELGERTDKVGTLPPAHKPIMRPAEQELKPGIYFTPAPSFTKAFPNTENRDGTPGRLATGISLTPAPASGSASQNPINPGGLQNTPNANDVTTDDLKAVCRAIWKRAQKFESSDNLAHWLHSTAVGDQKAAVRLPNRSNVNEETVDALKEERYAMLDSNGELEDSINIMLSAIAEDQVIVERNKERMDCIEIFLQLEPRSPPNVDDVTAEDLKAVWRAIWKRAYKLEGSNNLAQRILSSAVDNQNVTSQFPDVLNVNDKTMDELEIEYRATLNSTYKLVESVNLMMAAIAENMATLERNEEALKSDEVLLQSQRQMKNYHEGAINSSGDVVQPGNRGVEEAPEGGLHL